MGSRIKLLLWLQAYLPGSLWVKRIAIGYSIHAIPRNGNNKQGSHYPVFDSTFDIESSFDFCAISHPKANSIIVENVSANRRPM